MKLKAVENNWTKFKTDGKISGDEDVQSRTRIGFNIFPGLFTASIEGTLNTHGGFSVAFGDELNFRFDALIHLCEWFHFLAI